MPTPLTLEDIRLCREHQRLLRLFCKLGYTVESELIALPKAEIGFAPADMQNVRSLYLLADQESQLQVVLFELETLAQARLRSLAANFLDRGGHYLLVATDDYRRVAFINPRWEGGKVKIRKLVVDTAHPTRHDLDVLNGLAVEGQDPDALYQAQCAAFDVEAVTNRFYKEYAALFRHVAEIIREQNKGVRQLYDEQYLHAFTQRLLGRMMFLYFIQKKGWLAGDTQFLTHQFWAVQQEEGNYYARVLEPLFFETLNKRREDDGSRWGPIPYLNGGLFDREYDFILHLPNDLFDPHSATGILGFFNNYNFTVTEDTPIEQEVAVDPEMLGKVFENMMETRERGKSGTFYTPRPIVHYMCRQALLGYLEEETGLDRPLLEAQFEIGEGVDGDDLPSLSVEQANKVETTLENVRVLDPAVGTAAFLVGVLHELVSLKRACYLAKGVYAPRSSALVATWKRHFIAHALYGVDIKPEAIEIAKLRLWLSLVVDLERDQIEPLPNLDYKLMVGNSLIETVDGEPILPPQPFREKGEAMQAGLPGVPTPPAQLSLEMGAAEKAQAELLRLKERFFRAEPEELPKLRQQIQATEREIVLRHLDQRIEDLQTWVGRIAKKGARVNWRGMKKEQRQVERLAAQMARLDDLRAQVESGELPFFLYRLHFFEVFQEQGGFDIVIANPPYVRQEDIKDQKDELEAAYPDVFDGRADLYIYFYARGLDLLRNDGLLSFISTNKYMRAGYGRKLRAFLSEKTTIQTILDFGDLPVFKAIAYPSILITRKSEPPAGHQPRALTIDTIDTLKTLYEEVSTLAWTIPQIKLSPIGWTLQNPEVLSVMDKLRSMGRPLNDVVNGKFYMGVKTGYNKAFVIGEETCQLLLDEDPRSAEIIKPWLRGRDVKRWRVDWQGLYVIFTHHGIEIERYPAILEYLRPFRKRLEKRATSANHAWYELQQPQMGIFREFDKNKIIWPDIAPTCYFGFEKQGYYLDMTGFAMPTEDFYSLGILNSGVIEWFMKQISSTIQQGFIRFKRLYIKQIPIPNASQSERAAIKRIVRQLLDLRGEGPQVADLEAELNARVYRLFGLSKEEVEVVEGFLE